MVPPFLYAVTLLVHLGVAPSILAGDFTGQVVGVIDGDTIEVLHNGKAQRVRLQGIDCPEKAQAFGNRAKQATSALSFAQEVTLQIHGKDKYGRVLADVLLADGMNVNHELVKDGCCWWYSKYAPRYHAKESQNEAREAKRRLWVEPASRTAVGSGEREDAGNLVQLCLAISFR